MRRPATGALVGYGLAAAGAVVLFLGWFGVSGNALPSKQLPYLISGGLGGLALIVVGAATLARFDAQHDLGRLEAQVAQLVGLLTEDPTDPAAPASPAVPASPAATNILPLVAAPKGTSYHRSDCPLVVGRTALRTLTPSQAQGLRRCRVCDPILAG